MGVSPARRAAFIVLMKVETEGAFSTDALHSSLLDSLTERDRALVSEVVLGCLRRQGEIDNFLTQAAQRGLDKLDPEVRVALRMGCYQMWFSGSYSRPSSSFGRRRDHQTRRQALRGRARKCSTAETVRSPQQFRRSVQSCLDNGTVAGYLWPGGLRFDPEGQPSAAADLSSAKRSVSPRGNSRSACL